MATIACLGWGSLIWDLRDLPIQGNWKEDGPQVKADFLRKSKDRHVTLVLDESAALVTSLSAKMSPSDITESREALRFREGIGPKSAKKFIGVWNKGGDAPALIPDLPEWAAENPDIDAVIWTALPAKFEQNYEVRSTAEIVSYLASLEGQAREKAEEYVHKAPAQIDTAYRCKIEQEMGWTSS